MNTPLVLLPGMMCDARLFAAQIAAFWESRPVIIPPMTGQDSVAAMAANVLRMAPAEFALAGLSMGGIVAMELVRQAPDRVTHLALMDTNAKSEPPKVAAHRDPQIARVQAGGLQDVMRNELMPYYVADGPLADDALEQCLAMADTLGPDVFADQSRALQTRPDQQDTLRQIKVPTLILCGEADRLCPPHLHELMHDLTPGSVMKTIKGAGHLPTLEQPQATNEALLQWLT